jgi:transposase-like protein
MIRRQGNRYTPKFKAKVLAEMAAGKEPVSHIIKRHQLSSAVVYGWKASASGAPYGSKKRPGTIKPRRAARVDHGIDRNVKDAISFLREARRDWKAAGSTEQDDGQLLALLALSKLEKGL